MLKWIKRIVIGLFSLMATLVAILLLTIPYSAIKENDIKISSAMSDHYWLLNAQLLQDFSELPEEYNGETNTFDIEIKNGLIISIAPSDSNIQENLQVDSINLNGKWLFPGLIDLHVHVFDKSDFAGYLSYGVTSVRNMMGFPVHLKWREQIKSGDISGPNFVTASPTLNAGGNGGPFHKYVDSPEQVKSLVKEYKAKGFDLIKFYDGLDYDLFTALSQTAKAEGMPFAGHPPHSMAFSEVLDTNPVSIEHIEEIFNGVLDYDLQLQKLEDVISQLNKRDVPVVTTFTAYENIYLSSEQRHLIFNEDRLSKISPMIRFIGSKQLQPPSNDKHRQWIIDKRVAMHNLLSTLVDNNVAMVLGTDTGPAMTVPGLSVLEEMSLMESLGMAEVDVLSMATKHAAKVLNQSDVSGTVRIGERADLLILSSNPLNSLDALREPDSVIQRGNYFNDKKLAELRTAATQHQSVYHTLGYFLAHLLSVL